MEEGQRWSRLTSRLQLSWPARLCRGIKNCKGGGMFYPALPASSSCSFPSARRTTNPSQLSPAEALTQTP
eukprot:551098-Hanusia_phi.AAC.1